MESAHPSNIYLILFFIFLALVLVSLNAFFVAAEFAIVKVRRTRLEELEGLGVSSAKTAIVMVDKLDEYLSATQLGITLVSLALGWIGEESFFSLFKYIWPDHSSETFHYIATGASFFIITIMHVVLGELVPKSMAIQRAEIITLKIAFPLKVFYTITKPLIHTFTWIANTVLKLIGYGDSTEAPLSEDELKIVMRDSKDEGVISDSEAQIINRAFSFSDKTALDIMIKKEETHFISLKNTFQQNKTLIQSEMYTRFPVCSESMDNVVGVLNTKDIRFLNEESNSIFTNTMNEAVYVLPGTKQDKLMKLFTEKRSHLFIVRDKKNIVLGIVTLEDVLEQLVGEIIDEHGN